jgi:hypothetical protein
MKLRITSRSAQQSCLLLPSPISCPKRPLPLPLQHRTVRRQRFQRRRLRMKAAITVVQWRPPIMSDETTTEDHDDARGEAAATKTVAVAGDGSAGTESTEQSRWAWAPESSTEDKDDEKIPVVDEEGQTKGTVDERSSSHGGSSSNNDKKRSRSSEENDDKTKPKGLAVGKTILSLVSEMKRKKRAHHDVTSLVSPITSRSSKRQRFSF